MDLVSLVNEYARCWVAGQPRAMRRRGKLALGDGPSRVDPVAPEGTSADTQQEGGLEAYRWDCPCPLAEEEHTVAAP